MRPHACLIAGRLRRTETQIAYRFAPHDIVKVANRRAIVGFENDVRAATVIHVPPTVGPMPRDPAHVEPMLRSEAGTGRVL
jgi:hypothetical protein